MKTITQGYVLVGGWPGSGKTTLARALATELDWPCLAKDEIKEALVDELGAPATVEDSQRLGRAAVNAVLRVAQGHHSAVIDSTWFARTLPLVNALGGPFVEVRCTTTSASPAGAIRPGRETVDISITNVVPTSYGAPRSFRWESARSSKSTPVALQTLRG